MPCHIDTPVRPVRAPRHDGWTPERTQVFFETLAAGHSVVRACARVGLSRRAAHKARLNWPFSKACPSTCARRCWNRQCGVNFRRGNFSPWTV